MFSRIIIATLAAGTLFISSCVQKEYYTVEPPAEPSGPQYNYIFDDDFNNNINNWTFSDPDNAAYVTLVNSWLKYTYMPPNDGTNTVAISTGAKLHRNFLVQTRIRSDYAMGLCFGVSDNDYGYSFFIDNDGYFALYKEGSATESFQRIMEWQESEAIYRDGWNEVEFEQTGNYWMGYINGVNVFKIQAKPINGNKIGYIVLAGTTGYADYLTVQW